MCFITITKITFGFSNQINYFQLQWNMLIMWKCSLSSRKPTLMKHTETSTLHSILSTFQCGKVSPSMKHKNSLNTGDCLSWERAYQMFLPAGCRFHRIFLRGSLTVSRVFSTSGRSSRAKASCSRAAALLHDHILDVLLDNLLLFVVVEH